MNKKKPTHSVETIFVLMLFALFALSAILLTGTGAGVYKSIVLHMNSNNDFRTAVSYITNKIHRNDIEASICISNNGESDCIMLIEEIDNIPYCTYLYCEDGYLKEYFARLGQEFPASGGTDILKVRSFHVEKTDSRFLTITIVTEDNSKASFIVYPKSNDMKHDFIENIRGDAP